MKDSPKVETQSSSFSNITWVGIIIGMGGVLFLIGMLFGHSRQDDVESPQ